MSKGDRFFDGIMILDLRKFITEEKPYWAELESLLSRLERKIELNLDLKGLQRLHYLYQRASADLAKISTFSAEPATRLYLEALVSRAYGEIHGSRRRARRFMFGKWFFSSFPRTFRRHIRAFAVSALAMLVGSLLGAALLILAPDAKGDLLPFGHLQGDPSERVAREESAAGDRLADGKATFSSMLMTNNIKVSITTLALGITWGIGTLVTLFYNGVILGAVALDYILAGESVFLLGWLLPHGAIEIPAILLAGQAGLVLGGALIGWGESIPMRERLRAVVPDLVTLIGGVALLLVWAGVIESFLSQYHEPVIPYGIKIGFGVIELILLAVFLGRCGRASQASKRPSGEVRA